MRVVFRCLEEELCSERHVLPGRGLRRERRGRALGVRQLERAVHLVGGDVVEHLPVVFLREAFPVFLSGLQQRESSHHVGARESERVLYRPVHMALGGGCIIPSISYSRITRRISSRSAMSARTKV